VYTLCSTASVWGHATLHQIACLLTNQLLEKEKELYSCFQQSILVVWDFIELMGASYLDKTAPLAVSISKSKLQQIEATYGALIIALQQSHEVLPAITQILERYWQSLFTTVQSYQTLAYVHELLRIIDQWLEQPPGNVPIHQLFVQMNFNHQDYLQLVTQQIMQEVSHIASPIRQYEYLLQQYQCVNQWVVLTKGSPYPQLPNLKPYLLHWLKIEIQVVEKKMAVLKTSSVHANTILQINATVKALAIIGRAAFDTKLILNQNKTAVYQWLSGHLATIGSDAVSYKTLYKRGSQPALKDKELAKEILMQLYNQIRKY